MERITKRIDEKHACYAICEKECPDGIYADNQACMCTASKMAAKRLLEYEDTGLTPDQIVEQTNAGWIPVEERLPKTNGTYNVTRHIDGHFISDSAYFDGQNTWHSDNRVNHSRPYLTDVIAWRPLPEPYRQNKQRRVKGVEEA